MKKFGDAKIQIKGHKYFKPEFKMAVGVVYLVPEKRKTEKSVETVNELLSKIKNLSDNLGIRVKGSDKFNISKGKDSVIILPL